MSHIVTACTVKPQQSSSTSEPIAEPTYDVYAYTLGTPVEFDEASAADWMENLKGGDEVYQFVWYKPAENWDKVCKEVYKYDDFFQISGDQKTLFEDKYYLSAELNCWCWAPYTGYEPCPNYISDPAVFGAFEELVMGLDYSQAADAEFDPQSWTFSDSDDVNDCVNYYLEAEDGSRVLYSILRDGTAAKREGDPNEAHFMLAEKKLTECDRAYFFAAALCYGIQQLDVLSVEGYSTGHPLTITVTRGDEVMELTDEKGMEFLGLVFDSVKPGDCTCRVKPMLNCDVGEHGEKVLSFKVDQLKDTFELYSDGALINHYLYIYTQTAIWDGVMGQYFDYITVNCFAVSEARFDVDAVLELLNGN